MKCMFTDNECSCDYIACNNLNDKDKSTTIISQINEKEYNNRKKIQ